MPKIIENIRERLLVEARRQVMQNGYGSMTIRSVAKECGVGVGTVYNYFSSKDMLVAGFMLEDWQQCLTRIGKHCGEPGVNPGHQRCVSKEAELPFNAEQESSCDSYMFEGVAEPEIGCTDSISRDRFEEILRGIHNELSAFIQKYTGLFQDKSAGASFASAFPERHRLLRSQIAAPLRKLCESDFHAEFLAENLLTWTMEGRDPDEIITVLTKLM